MRIDITNKEYRLLVDMFEIADWVLHSYRSDSPEETKGYRDLQQKLYALSREAGMEDLIRYDAELGQNIITEEYEEQSGYMSFIEDYENDHFWEELISRLADRDLTVQEGLGSLNNMSVKERLEKLLVLEEKYAREFEENGIANLKLHEDFQLEDRSR